MLIIPSVQYRKRPGREVPPAALMLVAAEYEDASWVHLTFDRPIDIAAFNGGAIVVDDGVINNQKYIGTGGVTLIGPARVEIWLVQVAVWPGADTRLNAGADSGITAIDDRGTWAGVHDLLLPFP